MMQALGVCGKRASAERAGVVEPALPGTPADRGGGRDVGEQHRAFKLNFNMISILI